MQKSFVSNLSPFPYKIITGDGLGVSYSSFKQIGDVLPSKDFGQAKIRVFANASNGNLVIQDHVTRLSAIAEMQEFSMVYNSQNADPKKCWSLGLVRRMSQVPPDPIGNKGTPLVLEEKDGHLTKYTYGPGDMYWAPGLKNGLPFFKFIDNQWRRYDPDTGISEYYDHPSGLLRKRVGHDLRGFTYEYDNANQLTCIKSNSSNNQFKIDYTYRQDKIKNTKLISSVTISSNDGVLKQYQFDELGRLVAVYIPKADDNAFVVKYEYYIDSSRIKQVTQSDGTVMAFYYDTSYRLTKIRIGDMRSSVEKKQEVGDKELIEECLFDYSNASNIKIEDGFNQTQIQIDSQKRLTQLIRQVGLTHSESIVTETTKYNYTASGHVDSIVYPDGSKESFTYGKDYCMLQDHVLPNGQVTTQKYSYDSGFVYHMGTVCDLVQPDSMTQLPDSKLEHKQQAVSAASQKTIKANTVFVYQFDYPTNNSSSETKLNNPGKTQVSPAAIKLAFIISPTGKVTQLKRNFRGDVEYVREFLKEVKLASPDAPPDYQSMVEWASSRVQNTSLVHLDRDDKARIDEINHYSVIKSDGTGDSVGMSQELMGWDMFDDEIRERTLYDSSKPPATTERTFDRMGRKLSELDALKALTSYKFKDDLSQSSLLTTYPNQLQRTDLFSPAGNTTRVEESIPSKNLTRVTTYKRNASGFLALQKMSDQRCNFAVFDRQQRLAAEITHTGITRRYLYDNIHRYKQTISYSQTVKTETFYDPTDPESVPDNDTVYMAIKPILNDPETRSKYEFKDESNRLKYEVDEENYIIEHFYDTLNRPTGIVRYSNKISADDLTKLINGQPITLSFNCVWDRYNQTIYDLDGKVIMEVDPEGYITEYIRDAGGRVIEKIIYQNNIWVELNGKPIPKSDPKDAHSYYIYDARGQCVGEVDAEGYYTQHTYYANGKLQTSKTYYNELTGVDLDNFKKQLPFDKPIQHKEDQTTTYTYDELGRLIQVDGSNGKRSLTAYDNMGQVTAEKTVDLLNQDKIAADYQRGTQSLYDAFGQVIAQANPFVNELLMQPGADQKKIWETQSQRTKFDPVTGLKLQTTDPLGFTTTYFYDLERRPIFVVGPTGIVVQTTYNNFNQIETSRVYLNRLTAEQIAALKGGFISQSVQDLFKPDDNNDRISKFAYDKRGLLKQKTDPEGNITQYEYNAFKQCELEIKPLSKDKKFSVLHFYDVRGNEKATITTNAYDPHIPRPDDLRTTVAREFKNPLGKQTAVIEACSVQLEKRDKYLHLEIKDQTGSRSETRYDKRGYVQETLNPSQLATNPPKGHRFVHDAFGRVKEETDSLGKTTTHDYDQTARTHTINYPEGVTETIQENIFGETVSKTNSNVSLVERWQHEPDGQVKAYWDPLANSNVTKSVEEKVKSNLPTAQYKHDLNGKKTNETNARGIVKVTEYDGAGSIFAEIHDAGGLALKTTTERLDGVGGQILITDPRKIRRLETADRCGRTTQSIIDPAASLLQLKPNGLRSYLDMQQQKVKTAASNKQEFKADLEIKETKQLKDPSNLQVLTQTTYNPQGDPLTVVRGSVTNPDQSNVTFTRDEINRSTGKIIDPNGLNLQTKKQLDLRGKTISETDPKGNVKWHFYDETGRKRFTIDAEGGVQEWRFDTENHLTHQLVYENILSAEALQKIKVTTSLQDVVTLAKTLEDPNDSINYFYYDDLGRERFQVTRKGAVSEKIYDKASREIQSNRYYTPITDIQALTTTKLIAFASEQKSDNDRKIYYIKDANGRNRFTIDAKGFITEKCFDANGNELAVISYATQIINLQDRVNLSVLPEKEVRSKLKSMGLIQLDRDRVVYKFYDSFDRQFANVNGEAAITRYDFDENGNQVKACRFADRAASIQLNSDQPLFTDYDKLTAEVLSRVPDPVNKKDRVTIAAYDAANRKITTTVALNGQLYTEVYERDSLGNIQSHTDKLGNKWHQDFDRAERLTCATAPVVEVTEGIPDPQGSNSFILPPVVPASIKTRTQYDAADNEKVLMQALVESEQKLATVESKQSSAKDKATFDPRIMQCEYNSYNKVTKKTIPQVAVDDPNKPASKSIRERPEKTKDLVEKIAYNGKQKKVFEQDAAGHMTFYVFDEEGYQKFQLVQIDSDKPDQCKWRLSQIDRNPFGEAIKIIQYAATIYYQPTDLERANGIKPAAVKTPASTQNDKIVSYERDQRGDVTLIQEGKFFYYSPNKNGTSQAGVEFKQAKKETNAYQEEVYNAQRLFDSTGMEVWAEDITWRDRAGQVAATSNPLQFVKRIKRNAFGEEESRIEYDANLPGDLRPCMTSIDALDKALTAIGSKKDRKFTTEYDQAGNTIKFTRVGVLRQELTLDQKNVPSINDKLPAQDISQSSTYNALGKITSSTDENGNTKFFYYNALGLKIAEAGILRVTDPKTGAVVIPLTYFYYNAAGQYTGQSDYINGTEKADLTAVPKVKLADPQDRCKMEIHDKRGLTVWKQDYEAHVTGYTFNENGKEEARKYYQVTNLQEGVFKKFLETRALEAKTEYKQQQSQTVSNKVSEDSKDIKSTKDLTLQEVKANQTIHLDEVRKSYSATNQLTKEIKLRDGTLVKTTLNLFNSFDEQTAQSDGEDLVSEWRRGPDGQVFASNDGDGVWKITLRNLKGEVTSTIISGYKNGDTGAIDLSKYTYDDLATLVTKTLTDTNLLKTDNVRDLLGQSVATVLPGYIKTDPKVFESPELKEDKTKQTFDDMPELIDEDDFCVVKDTNIPTDTQYCKEALKQNTVPIKSKVSEVKDQKDAVPAIESKQEIKEIKSTPKTDSIVRPVQERTLNAWGEVTATKNALGFITNYELNDLGKAITQISPPVSILMPDNTEKVVELVDKFAYNKKGELIATIDANQNTQGYVLNAAGQPLQTALADGVSSWERYDGFNRKSGVADDRVYWWSITHDRRDKIIASTPPSGAAKKNQFIYNELGSRIADVFADNTCNIYNLDSEQNVVASYEPMGQCTRREFNWKKLQTKEINPDNTVRTWQYSAQGQLTSHTDLSNVPFTIENDFAGRTVKQFTTGATGKHGTTAVIAGTVKDPRFDYKPTQDQNLVKIYQGDRLQKVIDSTNELITLYDCDEEKQRFRVKTTNLKGDLVYQNSRSKYNPIGQEFYCEEIFEPLQTKVTKETKHDGVGNILASVFTGKQVSESRNTFDKANRPVILNGVWDPIKKEVKIDTNVGTETGYENGYPKETKSIRKSDPLYPPELMLKSFKFDNDGYLSYRKTNFYAEENRFYNCRGWPQHVDITLHPKGMPPITQVGYDVQRNANGWPLVTIEGSSVTTVGGYTPMGLMTKETVESTEIDPKDHSFYKVLTTFGKVTYNSLEEQQLYVLGGTAQDERTPDPGPYSETWSLNDANGFAAGKADNPTSIMNKGTKLITTHDGRIIFKVISNREQVPYVFGMQRNLCSPSGNYWGWESGSFMPTYYMLGMYGGMPAGFTNLTGSGILAENEIYEPISEPFSQSFSTPLPQSAQVNTGDTYASISDRFTTDESRAPMLALVNGSSVDEKPEVNRKLNFPDLFHQPTLNDRTHPSYQVFLDRIRGSITPHLSLAPRKPPKAHHPSFLKEMEVVIAGAIVALAAPYLAEFIVLPFVFGIAAGTATIAEMAVVTAVTGTLLSMAEQGIVTGHVSMLTAIGTGIAAGITAGVSYAPNGGVALMANADLITAAKQGQAVFMKAIGEQVLKAASIAVSNQMLQLVGTGRFDLGQIAASIAAQLTSAGLQVPHNIPAKFIEGAIDGGSATIISDVLTGKKINMRDVAADALGTGALSAAMEAIQETQNAIKNANIQEEARKQALQEAQTNANSFNRVTTKLKAAQASTTPQTNLGHKQPSLQDLQWQRELDEYVDGVMKPLKVAIDPGDPRWGADTVNLAQNKTFTGSVEEAMKTRLARYQQTIVRSTLQASNTPFWKTVDTVNYFGDKLAAKMIIGGRDYFTGVGNDIYATIYGNNSQRMAAIEDLALDAWNIIPSGRIESFGLKLVGAGVRFFSDGGFEKLASEIRQENALRQHVFANIAESQRASKTSNFLVLAAKEDQILAGYTPDAWSMMSLRKGDVVYGGLPSQTAYYTSRDTLMRYGSDSETFFKSLQVESHPVFGYRTEVGIYEVVKDIRIPGGVASANPALGGGMGEQFYIKNFSSSLRLINKIEIGDSYEHEMFTYRSRP